MTSYYNELDPHASRWLRNLIGSGLIPDGTVDDRSIREVCGPDLAGYRQHHFFAGIGGWPLALEMAGWPAARPVWTGSCPCQPFSSAGKRKGAADDRHLWPEFLRLIAKCRPPAIFGEQVASKDGREWLAGVRADLEALGYAVGATDLCAAGSGAPHIRQRLFWVADAAIPRWREQPGRYDREDRRTTPESGRLRDAGGLGDAASEQVGRARQPWQDGVWLPCLDGKARRIEPGTFPLAHGVSARVGRLRAYGNAIVPQIAAEFITAFMEIKEASMRQIRRPVSSG